MHVNGEPYVLLCVACVGLSSASYSVLNLYSMAGGQGASPARTPLHRSSLPPAPDPPTSRDPLLMPIAQMDLPTTSSRPELAGRDNEVSTVAAAVSKGGSWARHEAALLLRLLQGSYFSVLLVAVPLGLAAGFLGWTPLPVFTLNLIALIPLALLLGDVTEDLAEHYGDVIGGLLNATFGNVVEVVLAVSALNKELYTVVATSLLGSILSNLLLVLGENQQLRLGPQPLSLSDVSLSRALMGIGCHSVTPGFSMSLCYTRFLDAHWRHLHS